MLTRQEKTKQEPTLIVEKPREKNLAILEYEYQSSRRSTSSRDEEPVETVNGPINITIATDSSHGCIPSSSYVIFMTIMQS